MTKASESCNFFRFLGNGCKRYCQC